MVYLPFFTYIWLNFIVNVGVHVPDVPFVPWIPIHGVFTQAAGKESIPFQRVLQVLHSKMAEAQARTAVEPYLPGEPHSGTAVQGSTWRAQKDVGQDQKIPHSKAPRKSHRRFDLFDSFWTGTGSLSHHGILGGLMDLATLWFQQETLDCKRITSARKKWAITISQNVGYIHIHNILMNMYILAFTCHSKGLDTEIWFLIKLEMQLREEILHHLG